MIWIWNGIFGHILSIILFFWRRQKNIEVNLKEALTEHYKKPLKQKTMLANAGQAFSAISPIFILLFKEETLFTECEFFFFSSGTDKMKT